MTAARLAPETVLLVGDLAEQHVDAVVRATGPALLPAQGDDVLLRRGGPELVEAARRQGVARLEAGAATATTAGRLPARWVLHVAPPAYSLRDDRSDALAGAYRALLALADELGARSLAVPALSADAPGWSLTACAETALRTVASTPTRVAEVRFVLDGGAQLEAFTTARRRTTLR